MEAWTFALSFNGIRETTSFPACRTTSLKWLADILVDADDTDLHSARLNFYKKVLEKWKAHVGDLASREIQKPSFFANQSGLRLRHFDLETWVSRNQS